MYLQTQKMPDENYIRDVDNAIQRLILKKSTKYIGQLEEYFTSFTEDDKQSEEYTLNINVYH